jgi:S-adenosylmethionine hydrolase
VALPGVITLTTDFGIDDGYVASIKGVILSINPGLEIIDVCHTVRPQNILQASFIINSVYSYFPEGSIHIVVVDPGVGSKRKAIIVKTPHFYFIAPDNGVLSYPLIHLMYGSDVISKNLNAVTKMRRLPSEIEAVSISNPRFWSKDISPVFHGRDIFAPVAAHLSLGVSLDSFGNEIKYVNILCDSMAYKNVKGEIVGKVIQIDYFGNIVTNIEASSIAFNKCSISIGGRHIEGIDRYYAQKLGLLAVVGSSGYLEISIRNSNASQELGINIGDNVVLSTK